MRWYRPERRPFAWRSSRDAFHVTVCEVLLQRTNAEKVAPVSAALLTRYPTARALARAPLTCVKRLLHPLGLPRRAIQLRAIAKAFAVAGASTRPQSDAELQALPGIGPYCSAAIRVLAYGEADALVDEHVLRVFRRVFSVIAPARRHPTAYIRALSKSLVPIGAMAAKEYNLGILDLGRLVCRPTDPRCNECPIRGICDYANTEGRPDD